MGSFFKSLFGAREPSTAPSASTEPLCVRVEVNVTEEPGIDGLALAERIALERNTPPLTRDLIRRFGGHGFIFNLRMWEARVRDGESCSYVPPDDYYRKRFDVLASTGVAVAGSDVPLEMRLRALPVAVLREAATALNVGKIRSRVQGAAALAGAPGIEVWLGERYRVDSFFLLRPEPWSYQELEALWHACEKKAEGRS